MAYSEDRILAPILFNITSLTTVPLIVLQHPCRFFLYRARICLVHYFCINIKGKQNPHHFFRISFTCRKLFMLQLAIQSDHGNAGGFFFCFVQSSTIPIFSAAFAPDFFQDAASSLVVVDFFWCFNSTASRSFALTKTMGFAASTMDLQPVHLHRT